MGRWLGLAVCVVGLLAAACGSGTSPSPAAAPSGRLTEPVVDAPSPAAVIRPAVAAPCTARELKYDPKTVDLTGAWRGDDGGIYYLRQLGNDLWWSGMSGRVGSPSDLGRDWNNVAKGTINADLTIDLDWADVPRGGILGHGTLHWKIIDDGTGNIVLKKMAETGTGFGGSRFTACQPG
jgi:hypothetical protein